MLKLLSVRNTRGREFFCMRMLLMPDPIVKCFWKGDADEYMSTKNALIGMIDVVRKTKCVAILHDTSETGTIIPELEEWMSNVWIPLLGQSKLKYLVNISPQDSFKNFLKNKTKKFKDCGVEILFFDNELEAMKTLLDNGISSSYYIEEKV